MFDPMLPYSYKDHQDMNEDVAAWKHFVPSGTILGPMTVEEIFFFDKCPMCFTCKDSFGYRYLAVLHDRQEETDIFLFVRISHDRYGELKVGGMDLRTAFQRPEDKVWLFRMSYPSDEVMELDVPIPDQFLPKEGVHI